MTVTYCESCKAYWEAVSSEKGSDTVDSKSTKKERRNRAWGQRKDGNSELCDTFFLGEKIVELVETHVISSKKMVLIRKIRREEEESRVDFSAGWPYGKWRLLPSSSGTSSRGKSRSEAELMKILHGNYIRQIRSIAKPKDTEMDVKSTR